MQTYRFCRCRMGPFHLENWSLWLGVGALVALCGSPVSSSAQTAFLDFKAPGQYTNGFNPWNDVGGANAGNYGFAEGTAAGIDGGGGVRVFQSSDTTAVYTNQSWNFATNGATIILSLFIHTDGQSSGNKVQLGLINTTDNGLNDNTGVAFESYRFIPQSATTWTVREQYRSGDVMSESVLGTVNIQIDHWYRFEVGLTNSSGAAGDFAAGCQLYDEGPDGLSPGSPLITFPVAQSHSGQDIARTAVAWPAFRAFQNGGIDAWDNFLVYTKKSPPRIMQSLTNETVVIGEPARFRVGAVGPGTLSYSWYTNGVIVAGESIAAYTNAVVGSSLTNVTVVVRNANGAATNHSSVTVITPEPASVANLPATAIRADEATMNGQVVATGGEIPEVTLFYGAADEGTNAAAWAQSISVGPQTGYFARTVTGLASNTDYYFTARAVNEAGVAWASPSMAFTTLATNPPLPPSVAVLTQHNNLARTGANLEEHVLNIHNVNTNEFGLLYRRIVDDQIYAQPLVMTNVNIPGKGAHNLVIVATVNDSVYAFDADDPSVAGPYWKVSFLGPNVVPPRNTDMTGACGGNYKDFSGNMGIVGTPVIDPVTGTLYLVARTKENGTQFVQRLHALDVATGKERPNSPVVITASYPGTGAGSSGGMILFDPQRENQRPGLALVDGVVYISWASHCDWGPYHGWVIGYDAATLRQVTVYNDTPNGSNAGIWMSGQAPAGDSNGDLFLSTGNGTVGDNGDPRNLTDRGESFLKLTLGGNHQLQVTSWFTPYNWQDLENGDIDLGSAGLLLIPGTDLAFSGGKQGVVYLVHRDNMGGLSAGTSDTNVVQHFQVASGSHQLHTGAVWWDGPDGSYAYIWVSSDYLRQYKFDRASGKFLLPNYAQGPTVAPNGQPGGILSVSADGTNADTGIVWASHQLMGNANQQVQPGILRAYNAQDVSQELWNSQQDSARDAVGNFAKFNPPTVANGKVYLATFSDQLDVYGLLPRPSLHIAHSAGKILLSLPATEAAGYSFQLTPRLDPSAWQKLTNAVTTTNGTLQVTVPDSAGATFFRLEK